MNEKGIEIIGNYICQKHKQPISLIVMEEGVLPENQLLCLQCLNQYRQILKSIMGVELAKEMIKEKIINMNQGKEEMIKQKIENLKNIQQNLVEQSNIIINNLEEIKITIQRWTEELTNSIQKFQYIDLLQGLELLKSKQQSEYLAQETSKAYFTKLEQAFRKLLEQNELQKCFRDFMKSKPQQEDDTSKISQYFSTSGQIEPPSPTKNKISYSLIYQEKQVEYAQALAFNKTGSTMVAGMKNDIRVWQFDQGKLSPLTVLKCQDKMITCLIFSKFEDCFISGNASGYIYFWKSIQLQWNSPGPRKSHKGAITCIIMDKNENQIISCSRDQSIVVWKKFINNIDYDYHLEKDIMMLQIVQVQINQETIYCHVEMVEYLYYGHKIILENGYFNLKLLLLKIQQGYYLFEIWWQFNGWECNFWMFQKFKINNQLQNQLGEQYSHKNIILIIIYSSQFTMISNHIYFIKKTNEFSIVAPPIDCGTYENFGAATQDGEYLVIWNALSTEFRVYKIDYDV